MASGANFEPILAELEADKELAEKMREKAKDLDRAYRAMTTTLNKAHSTPARDVAMIVQQTAALLAESRHAVRAIIDLVPSHEYYKWCDTWSMTLQRTVYAIALAFYLSTGRLISKAQVSRVLAIRPEDAHRFHLATEEYLHALVSLINDLSRLAVNSVTLGDFGTPVRLSAFVKDLHAGFQLLNLKNDSLRKRFDSIKYDVKKIEEVVYDISLRGLVTSGPPDGIGSEADAPQTEAVLRSMSSDGGG